RVNETNKVRNAPNNHKQGDRVMLQSAYKLALAAALFGLLLAPGTSWGQAQRPRKVHDEAGFFSKEAINDANADIAKIKERHHKDLWIETVEKGPDKKSADRWAQKRAHENGVDGVYIVISKDPKHFEIYVGNKTREKGYFTTEDRDKVMEILRTNLGKNKDKALTEAAQYTLDTMNRHAPKTNLTPAKVNQAPVQAQAPARHDIEAPSWLTGVGGFICIALCGLLVIWVIFAL